MPQRKMQAERALDDAQEDRAGGGARNFAGISAGDRPVARAKRIDRFAARIPSAEPQPRFFGDSAAAQRLTDLIDRVARTSATVLISGETGSGKELVAQEVHDRSTRSHGRLVVFNCAAVAESLIESELFGHAAGSFTSATSARRGCVREAEGGTLFLDEIGELSLTAQTRLLRLLETRTVCPLGSETTVPVDVRFLAATNRDLAAMVRAGTFREDLYFRLYVVPIEVPPLRARADDIPAFALHFLARALRPHSGPLTISERAMAMLRLHDWPGNLRELAHVIERMAVLDRDGILDLDDLPAMIRGAATAQACERAHEVARREMDLGAAVAAFEAIMITQALQRTGGNRSQAAALLGIGRTTLLEKLKRKA